MAVAPFFLELLDSWNLAVSANGLKHTGGFVN